MAITIKKVSTKRELKKFIRFNYRMYKGNPYSVPDLYDDMLNTFNKKKKNAVEIRTFHSGRIGRTYFRGYGDDKIVGLGVSESIIITRYLPTRNLQEVGMKKRNSFGWIVIFIFDDQCFHHAARHQLIKRLEEWGKERGMLCYIALHHLSDLSDLITSRHIVFSFRTWEFKAYQVFDQLSTMATIYNYPVLSGTH